MEIDRVARLSIVGLGYGAGEQITQYGYRTIAASPWIGHFGLPDSLSRFLSSFGESLLDLDRFLDSGRNPCGFTKRAASIAVEAAVSFGRASVAVSGHPAFGNPFSAVASDLARNEGISCEVIAAPSAIDHYSQWYGDVLRPGTMMLDARDLLAYRYALDARLAVALWNMGYMTILERHQLASFLEGVWGTDWKIVLFHAGHKAANTRCVAYPLSQLGAWVSLVDAETLVVAPARTAG
jgi:hypothetical protein